ncbi:MAG TPA: PilZ domain-containing protein [Bosea sp. (in: a-proteobacteria)]|jgi:hypothetical protein|uniref:PilZ domain-containing protein n=1 Tax=Bosea sp. (in: a-proteobacteria) TaxID=1871050 RepID=UPI002E14D795|nr:PilZ domain-containing protein [Bosea sp. (in: a-proteobacteria)]
MTASRRQAPRSRIFQGASVVFNGRQSVLACTIRNWSDAGAMVRMSDWIALPETFELDIASQQSSIRVRQCWRRGDDVGVVFLTEADQPPCEVVSLAQARARRAGVSG